MAKRPVKKKPASKKEATSALSPVGKVEEHSCNHEGCKRFTVYMRRNRKTGEMEHWCAPHFQSDVVEPNKKAYLESQPKRDPFVAHHKRHPRKKVVKKGGALKPAVEGALATKKKVRVKK